jgi:uncharacterized protein YndB with AHSA1/START domain
MSKGLIARATITFEVPGERVWQSLVDPAAIKAYMFGADVVSEWRQGGAIVWRGVWQGRAYEDKGTILDVQPGRRLQYSHFSPLSGMPDAPENYHTVTIELSPDGARTRLVLTQDNNATEEERGHSQANWEAMLGGMKRYLEE